MLYYGGRRPFHPREEASHFERSAGQPSYVDRNGNRSPSSSFLYIYIYISLYSALESLARKIKTHPREYFLYSLLQLKIDFLLVLISEIDKYIYFFFHFFTTLQINIRKLS